MEENDFHCSAGDCGDGVIYHHRWASSDAAVESVASPTLRMAHDHILASAWGPGPVPHPLRRTWMASSRPLQFPPSHGRAVGSHDPGGTRTIPRRHAGTLRIWSIHD